MKNNDRKDLREVAWASFLSSFHSDPKSMPRTKDKFWPIGNEKPVSRVSEAGRQAMLNAVIQYQKEIHGKA